MTCGAGWSGRRGHKRVISLGQPRSLSKLSQRACQMPILRRHRSRAISIALALGVGLLAGGCTQPAASAAPTEAMMEHSAAPTDAMTEHSPAPTDAMMEHSPAPTDAMMEQSPNP